MDWIGITADVDKFGEAVQWFESLAPITREEFDKMEDSARHKAFTIAAQVELQVVQVVFDEMAKAIEHGTGYDAFEKALGSKLDNFPLPGHVLETTFINANQQAYNTGRWQQITDPELTAIRPYLMFDAVLDSRTTPHCREWDGVIRPASDPCWLTHSPQCHHRCRSGLRSLRESEAFARGVTASLPTEQPADGFGLAPPLRGVNPPAPNHERIDDDAWSVFMERMNTAQAELEAEDARIAAEREKRDAKASA